MTTVLDEQGNPIIEGVGQEIDDTDDCTEVHADEEGE